MIIFQNISVMVFHLCATNRCHTSLSKRHCSFFIYNFFKRSKGFEVFINFINTAMYKNQYSTCTNPVNFLYTPIYCFMIVSVLFLNSVQFFEKKWCVVKCLSWFSTVHAKHMSHFTIEEELRIFHLYFKSRQLVPTMWLYLQAVVSSCFLQVLLEMNEYLLQKVFCRNCVIISKIYLQYF